MHALPVYHGLREVWPQARIGWAVQTEFAPLIEPLPGLERTFAFDRRGGPLAWVRLRRELREWRPDWTVDVQGNCKSAAVSWCSGAARRTGPARQDWQEPFCDRVSTERAPPAFGPHAIHRMLALMDCVAPERELSFDLHLDETERRIGREEFARRTPAGDGPAWILNLGILGDRRTGPAERQAALAQRLAAEGCRVLLLSGPREASAGQRLAESSPGSPAV
ncbi:MAG: glycosyltransferase family 9 protein, partial [Planctomycetes bacterium]|nr:glycosyltransferase family 9 protein [Planctomycetota bacterium]